jgi:hypothetical protein
MIVPRIPLPPSPKQQANTPTKPQTSKWQAVTDGYKPNKATYNSPLSISSKTKNRYAALQVEDEENSSQTENRKPPKMQKPPPIFVPGVKDIKCFTAILDTKVGKESYVYKTVNNSGQVKLATANEETYRDIVNILIENSYVFHTYQLKKDRPFRVVLRHLHPSVHTDEIREALAGLGHTVRNITNVKHRSTKQPLPLFFVDIEPNDNSKEIYKIDHLLHAKVKFEPPRKKSDIVQCTRCQRYGHTKGYCSLPPRCVKCTKSHLTAECPKKDRKTPAKCVLCDGAHPANYKGCNVYRDLVNKRKPQTNVNQHQAKQHTLNVAKPPQSVQNLLPAKGQTDSYAAVLTRRSTDQEYPQRNPQQPNTSLENTLVAFLREFREMFNTMLNQNGMILNMLTTLVSKQ